jgi:hypothetical protein
MTKFPGFELESEWKLKIKTIAQSFFTAFSLPLIQYWETFKDAHFCSNCFGKLEELRLLLGKIEGLKSNVEKVKTEIKGIVKTSSSTHPSNQVLDTASGNGIRELRLQLSSENGKNGLASVC